MHVTDVVRGPTVVALLLTVFSCTGSMNEPECSVSADCALDEACFEGTCVATSGDGDGDGLFIGDGDGDVGDGDGDGDGDVVMGDGDGDGDGDTGCTVATETTDCPGGQLCIDGECKPHPPCNGTSCDDPSLVCNQATGECVRGEDCGGMPCECTAASCDDGIFCNGIETCDPDNGCLSGSYPCSGNTPVCDEQGDRCVQCTTANHCDGTECVDNVCQCEPDCDGRVCGDDGCGGSCGSCQAGLLCGDDGLCGCEPDCNGKQCGSDGCGGTCGNCTGGDVCQGAQCICQPECSGRECGPDGCGGTCGMCEGNDTCNNLTGQCECDADCTGRECGSDGCGGVCGPGCTGGEVCNATTGQCGCSPDCAGRECGDDGCGGTCTPGCGGGELCNDTTGQCESANLCEVLTDPLYFSPTKTSWGVGTLDPGVDQEFTWDKSWNRILDDFPLRGFYENTTITVDMTSASDTMLYLYNTSGTCSELGFDDDGGDGTNSQMVFTLNATPPDDALTVVATTYGAASSSDIEYEVTVSYLLCGREVAPTVYERCAPRYALPNFTCEQNNPCIGDGTDEFCCGNGVCDPNNVIIQSSTVCE
jgi:hypothetical protein